jgi:large subunit ribosomal protein L28
MFGYNISLMASGMKCYNCGKGIMVGHEVSHAKNRTRKVFKPNLHSARVIIDGTSIKIRLCTKCLRELKGRNKRSLKALEKSQTASQSSEVSSIAPAAAGLA